MIIFVTLGSQKFQFDRLLKKLDEIAAKNEHYVIYAQTGYSTYQPVNFKYKPFLNKEEFDRLVENADVIITHGGTGAIITALKSGKKVLAVPRLKQYGEHVDNHQAQIAESFENAGYICTCWKMKDLEKQIEITYKMKPEKYVSNTENMINALRNSIEAPRKRRFG